MERRGISRREGASVIRNRADGILGTWSVGEWAAQAGLIAAAVALPALCHLTGLPTRYMVPMHWPVVAAGLLYGWRGGLIVGLLSPVTNYVLTGYPLFLKMLAMTGELGVYGLMTGYLAYSTGWNRHMAVGVSLVAGRLVFLGLAAAVGATEGMAFLNFAAAAMAPGLPAAAVMTAAMPVLVGDMRR